MIQSVTFSSGPVSASGSYLSAATETPSLHSRYPELHASCFFLN